MPRTNYGKNLAKVAASEFNDGWDGVALASLARSYTRTALYKLVRLCTNSKSEAVQAQCAMYILDRGWGKTPITHAGDGEKGPITVEIIYRGDKEENILDITPDTKPTT